MKNKQSIIVALISTVFAVLVLVVGVIMINSNNSNAAGTIHLYITGENSEIIFDNEVSFFEDEVLIDVLNRHVKVKEGTGPSKGMIMGINNLDAPDTFEYYFKLIVNCDYATSGAWDMELNDGDSVKILYSSLSDSSTGC